MVISGALSVTHPDTAHDKSGISGRVLFSNSFAFHSLSLTEECSESSSRNALHVSRIDFTMKER